MPTRVQWASWFSAPSGVGEVAVEIARLGADRLELVVLDAVAALALVGIGHQVLVIDAVAAGVRPGRGEHGAGEPQGRLGLLLVPDVGQADPSRLLVQQDAGLEQVEAAVRLAHVGGIGEGLGDDGADREVDGVIRRVARLLPRRQLHETQLRRVVGEERGAQVVRHHSGGRPLLARLALEQTVDRELLRRVREVRELEVRRCRLAAAGRAAAAAGRDQRDQQRG